MFLLHSDIKVRIGGYFAGCLPSFLGIPYGGVPGFGRRIADEAKQNGSAIVSYGNLSDGSHSLELGFFLSFCHILRYNRKVNNCPPINERTMHFLVVTQPAPYIPAPKRRGFTA